MAVELRVVLDVGGGGNFVVWFPLSLFLRKVLKLFSTSFTLSESLKIT